jgi:hypothetical protein
MEAADPSGTAVTPTKLHGVTPQNSLILLFIATRISEIMKMG